MPHENHEPYASTSSIGADDEQPLILADRADLHIGDYVGFERITPNRDWRLALGKVIGFPCERFVKVAYYDPVNRETVAQDPISEEVIRKKAEEEDRMQLWHDREAMGEERRQALEVEKEATQDLFGARDVTLAKQAAIADMTQATIKELRSSRKVVKKVPARQWRDLRGRGEPCENMVRLMRSVLLVLYEDKATSWEEMEPLIKDENFLDRVLAWDCAMTPMSRPRRARIMALCSNEDLGDYAVGGGSIGGGGGGGGGYGYSTTPRSSRHRARSPGSTTRRNNASSAASAPPAEVPAHGEAVAAFVPLDAALRVWLNAQLACSEAAERQERAIDECFAEQQEQRVHLRKVNDMRVNISRIEVMMQESKCAIMGTDPTANPVMPLEMYPTDTIFYKRTYPDLDGRFVQEVILKDAVLINFGPMAHEDKDGYVRLTKAQADALRSTVHQAYIKHDADEMQDLLTRKDREEEEMAALRARIEALRARGANLTEEEVEELAQLEKLLEDAERRHRATLNRIAELYACGRGAREITMASKRIESRYTRLHLKMANDWSEILADPEKVEMMKEALRDDIIALLGIQREAVFDIDASAGSLLIDFTVRHNGELDDDELQEMVNNADFSALSLFYEKVTFKKTAPINTPEQEANFAAQMVLLDASRKRENFSGMGIRENLEDYYNADGTLDEEFGPEITNDVDYRKAIITIPIVREDYEEYALTGAPEMQTSADREDNVDQSRFPRATAAGLTSEDEEEEPVAASLPPTQVRDRAISMSSSEHQQQQQQEQHEEVVEGQEGEANAAQWDELSSKKAASSSSKSASRKSSSPKASASASASASAKSSSRKASTKSASVASSQDEL